MTEEAVEMHSDPEWMDVIQGSEDSIVRKAEVVDIPAPGWKLGRLRDVPEGADYIGALGHLEVRDRNRYYGDGQLSVVVEWRLASDLVTVEVEREVAQEFFEYADNCTKSKPMAVANLLPAIREALQRTEAE